MKITLEELLGIIRGLIRRSIAAIKVSDINDVSLTSLVDGDILYYNATTEKWENTPAGSITDSEYNAIHELLS